MEVFVAALSREDTRPLPGRTADTYSIEVQRGKDSPFFPPPGPAGTFSERQAEEQLGGHKMAAESGMDTGVRAGKQNEGQGDTTAGL